MATTWNRIQQAAGQNGAVASTTVGTTLLSTQNGSTLIAFVMCAVAGATITMPAGWTQIQSAMPTNPAGGTMQAFYYDNNPGGITSINATITSSLATIIVYEMGGVIVNSHTAYYDTGASGYYSNLNGASWGIGTSKLQSTNEFGLLCVGYIKNTVLTATYPSGFNEDANTITTAASGNAGLRTASNSNIANSTAAVGGLTLSGTPTNGPDTIFVVYLFSPVLPNNGFVGAQNYIVSN